MNMITEKEERKKETRTREFICLFVNGSNQFQRLIWKYVFFYDLKFLISAAS